MSNVTYVKGDLFNIAPKDSYLAHACNCQGVWGSGIAVQFRKRFPEAYKNYVQVCFEYGSFNIGHCDVFGRVVCLYTSIDYGENKCDVSSILRNTRYAIDFLLLERPDIKEIHMPKINSGLFAVPWEDTESILKEYDGKINFIVYEMVQK